MRHAAAVDSKLCDILGHHRLQVVVCGRLDDEALARVVSLEELGRVEEQQRHMKHLGVDKVRDGRRQGGLVSQHQRGGRGGGGGVG